MTAGRRTVVAVTHTLIAGPRRGVPAVMAVAAGTSVAGNYVAQPLLGTLRADLGLTATGAGALVAAAQVGYAVGLALLVPLGDRYPRRGLAAVLLLATAVLLALAGAAPNGAFLVVATAAAAVTSVAAQVIVPFAAEIAGPGQLGRAVGTVMCGVVLGGLVGRATAGLVADVAGWRSVYGLTAALLVVAAVAVVCLLPPSRPRPDAPDVLSLWRATAALLVELPALRRPLVAAAAGMASWSVHLTGLTLLLAAPPYGWSPSAIGLFGLLAAAGPLLMPVTGRLVDRVSARLVLRVGTALIATAWVVMAPASSGAVGWLVVGVALLNVGVQAMLTAAQAEAYALRPDARGRVNSVLSTALFTAAGAAGLGSALLWSRAGWTGACLLGAALAVVALAVRSRSSRTAPCPVPSTTGG